MTARPSPDDHLTLNRQATVTRLVAGSSHEVNNALQVISGTVELLLDLPDLPAPALKAVERIGAQAARAAAALAGLTVLTRVGGDTTDRVDLRGVVVRAVDLRRYAIGKAGLAVAVDAGETPLVVRGNSPQLLQLVVNLVNNAEQALATTPAGTITVRVAVEGGAACVLVEDDGPGLPAEVGDGAFAPFVTSRPRPDSVGLGLAVARQIAEAHGGTLALEPCARGARFVLRLPLAT